MSTADPAPTESEAAAAPADADVAGAPAGHVTTVVRRGGPEPGRERTFHLVGTAHVSRRSIDEVSRVIEQVRPDTVCVELCQTRFEAMTDDARWRKLDVFQVIRQGKVLFLVASLALQAFQRRLGERMGVMPGAELLAGVRAAERVGATVVLADRDVQVTLKRTWANVGFCSKVKLLGGLLASVFHSDEIDPDQIEALKDREHISDLMSELAKVMPEVKTPLIDERDRYLASRIDEAPGEVGVAVVGAGHVEGIVGSFGQQVDREELSRLPPPSRLAQVLKWVLPLVIVSAFAYGYFGHRGEGLMRLVQAWIVPNAAVAALFTLLAGGKPLSVLVAAVASPVTSLNPTITAGMVVGLVEARLRKPTVADCERVGREVSTLKGAWRNPVSRILLVAVASTIGSALGAYIGAAWVIWLL